MPSPSRTSCPSGTKLKKPTSSPSSSTTARRCVRRAGFANSSTRRGSADVSYHSYGNSYRHSAIAAACSSVIGCDLHAASLHLGRTRGRRRARSGASRARPRGSRAARRAGSRARSRRRRTGGTSPGCHCCDAYSSCARMNDSPSPRPVRSGLSPMPTSTTSSCQSNHQERVETARRRRARRGGDRPGLGSAIAAASSGSEARS